jgi:Ca2+-binding EF-hand superfamily protein
MHHKGWERRDGGGPGMMGGGLPARIIFSLMDADGDGKLSVEEFRAAHDHIFKAMDTDKDGTVTMQEMMDFMRGTSRPASQR